MTDSTNDIDALLEHLRNGAYQQQIPFGNHDPSRWAVALTALVAERDALAEKLQMQRNLRDLDRQFAAQASSDRDRELRERLVCAALTGIIGDISSYEDAADAAVRHADATLAAMLKQGGGA